MTLSDCNHLAQVIVIWQVQVFQNLYVTACTVIALLFVQAPGGLYSEGRFNGGFFALRVWSAYVWRGLFSEVYGMF